jgi:FkbM family methyltransferase
VNIRIPKRFDVVKPWLQARKQGREGLPSFFQLCHFLGQPGAKARGMRYVRSISEKQGFFVVALNGYDRMIYWPASMGLWMLGMILAEQFDPSDWHYYQIAETKIGPDDVVVDCGAAEGLFSVVAAAVCKYCYIVEPSPSFQPFLRRTFNGVKNAEIVPFLLSNYIGDSHMQVAGVSSRETEDAAAPSVPVTTIDAIFCDKNIPFTYLKADVEGAEMRLLEGAKKSIAQYRPRIAITTYHDPIHAAQIRSFLQGVHPDYRFRVKGIVPGGQPVMLHAW